MVSNNKKTILHLVSFLTPGGNERQLSLALPHLNTFNHIVVCLKEWGIVGDELRLLGFAVYFIPTPHFFSKKSISTFKSIVRKTKPDIIITYLPFADIFGRVWGRYYGIPKVICSLRSAMREWRYSPLIILNVLTQKLVDRFFAVSETVKKIYEKWGLQSGMTDVVHNGVEVSSQNLIALSSPNAPMIGYIAGLKRGKGHIILLRAFKFLIEQGCLNAGFTLALVGDGPRRLRLKRSVRRLGIENRVTFLGHRSDVRQLLAAFTIYCHPSLYEGMSNALLEAMAAGCPIIAADIPENRELLTNNDSALLVPPNDVRKLAEAMIYLINNPEERVKLAAQAKIEAQKFDINETARKLSYFINSVIAGK